MNGGHLSVLSRTEIVTLVPEPLKRLVRPILAAFRHGAASTPALTYRQKEILWAARYARPVLDQERGNAYIRDALASRRPFMATRLGAYELACVRHFVEHRRGRRHWKKAYPHAIAYRMHMNTGFFPARDEFLDRYAARMLEDVALADLVGIWYSEYEDVVCNSYCPGAELFNPVCLEAYRFDEPWSAALAGKRVLVVHPFAESIAHQYREKRTLLFANPKVLPEFELQTLKAVQSIAGSRVDYDTWFDALDAMNSDIGRRTFDVALIGAGAYGLSIAAHVKSLGRQAIHIGGATQILFGVRGRRWEVEYADSIARLFNEHWSKPLLAETPDRKDAVEDGAYW